MNTPQPAIRPLPRRLGLIVGKSFIDMARLGERQEHITKEHGTVPFFRIPVTDSAEIILIERHGEHNELGAPQVAHLANMWTLAELFVEGAITTAASQAVEQPNTLLQIGDLGIVSSFQPFNVILLDAEYLAMPTRKMVSKRNEKGHLVHSVSSMPAYSHLLQGYLAKAAKAASVPLRGNSLTIGFNTNDSHKTATFDPQPTVAYYKSQGVSLLNKTAVFEAELAQELGIPLATLGLVVRHAPGEGENPAGKVLDSMILTGVKRAYRLLDTLVKNWGAGNYALTPRVEQELKSLKA
ncbi:MAG: hypothetical protein WC759_01030 [Candidatus Micrarchaeia archaeon]|jgi:purine nucleoside phosphorylase